jgi:hypothetical protein
MGEWNKVRRREGKKREMWNRLVGGGQERGIETVQTEHQMFLRLWERVYNGAQYQYD